MQRHLDAPLDVQPEPPMERAELPGGEYAVITHQGPYEKLEETYAQIMGRWLPTSGRDIRDSQWFEMYRNDPATTSPDQLLTDIHIPLKRRGKGVRPGWLNALAARIPGAWECEDRG